MTLREVREGASKSLADCLRTEFRMVHHCCTARTGFVEGVSALLIDKRGQAKWDPPSIEQVWWSPNCGVRSTNACLNLTLCSRDCPFEAYLDTVHKRKCCRKHVCTLS